MLTKKEQRLRRARQTRIRIATQGVARLMVNRTNLHIYASVISGDGSKVLASASTAEADVRKSLGGSGKGGNNMWKIKWSASLMRRSRRRFWSTTRNSRPRTTVLWPTNTTTCRATLINKPMW